MKKRILLCAFLLAVVCLPVIAEGDWETYSYSGVPSRISRGFTPGYAPFGVKSRIMGTWVPNYERAIDRATEEALYDDGIYWSDRDYASARRAYRAEISRQVYNPYFYGEIVFSYQRCSVDYGDGFPMSGEYMVDDDGVVYMRYRGDYVALLYFNYNYTRLYVFGESTDYYFERAY